MSILRRTAAAAAVTSLAVVGWAVPASSVDNPSTTPTGYTTVLSEEGCELAVIDLATGELTDLPAGPSEEACVDDLAISAAGVVYGIRPSPMNIDKSLAAVSPAELVTFSMNGTPTVTPIVDEGGDTGFLAEGGIAVSPSGTIYVHLVTDNPACDTGEEPPVDTTLLEPEYAGDSVCLFTVDPTTGVASIIGTTGLYETEFLGLAWCGGLVTLAGAEGLIWATESASDGSVILGADSDVFPAGFDCDSATGGPLYGLATPDGGQIELGAVEVDVVTIDTATGTATTVASVDPETDVWALAVVPVAAPTPTTTAPPAAQAAELTPAFTG